MSDTTDTSRPKTRRAKDTSTHRITEALLDRATPIGQLDPHPQNARRRDDRAESELRQSLEVNGQYRAVVARELGERLQLLAGHGTVQAARQLGWTHVAVDVHAGLDDEAAARIVLVDNRTNDLAGYDDDLLTELLASLEDLAGTGYTDDDLAALLAGAGDEPAALTDPDDVPEPPAEARSCLGDVWLLGPHKVACGDSTDVGVYDAILGDAKVDLVWTDPPYGIAYEGGSKKRDHIQNDALDVTQLADFLREALGATLAATRPGAGWYVAAPHGPIGLAFSIVLHEFDVWRHSLIWVKNNSTFGRSDYHYRHEPIYYGWTPGGPHFAVKDRKQDTLWEVDRPSRSEEHPTMKPVALITRALENSSDKGALVIDPFGGSGSTLIACHSTGRVARLVELDPRYVDVICRRYQEHTGVTPILEATGEPVDFTTAKEE